MRFRRLLAILAPLLLLPALTAPASAASPWHNRSKDYLVTHDFWSQPLNMCVHVVVEGTMKYQREKWLEQSAYFNYRNPKLINPEISAFTKAGCARTSPLVRTATGADLTQRWYDYRCNVRPTVSVGFPWSISVGGSVQCGNVTLTKRMTTPRAKGGYEFAQFNSGNPVHWSELNQRTTAVCLGGSATVVIYKKGRSDSTAFPFTVCGD
jgi:hypothetical protein